MPDRQRLEEPTSDMACSFGAAALPRRSGASAPSVKALMLMPKDRSQMSAGSAFGPVRATSSAEITPVCGTGRD